MTSTQRKGRQRSKATTTTKKRRRQKWEWLRYRKGDVAHNLLVAAQRYIHAHKGTAVVLGDIKLIQMPSANPHCYELAVGFMGARPELKKQER